MALARANANVLAQQSRSTIETLEKSVESLKEELGGVKNEPLKEYILQSVHFDINQSTIRTADIPELMTLFNVLSNNYDLKAVIIGHTDDLGPEDFNEKLSIERALTVKTWLVNKGIAENRLEAKGESNSYPVIPNSEADARAVNRRTEIRLK